MKNIWLIVLGAILVVGVILFGWYKGGYDQAIALDENVKQSWSQVENQLQRRNDLIPNLVETVKGFATHEKTIFTEVARLRSQWGEAKNIDQKIATANEMTGALTRLLFVAENYPQLKSNENFLSLQAQLEGTENRIAVERMRYNQSIENFNRFRRSFFGRFFAAQAGVDKEAIYFKAVEAATRAPQVKFQ